MGVLGAQGARPAPAQRVLIVDREGETAVTLQGRLTQAGFSVIILSRGDQLDKAIRVSNPSVVMLDWDLQGVVAIDLIKNIRNSQSGKVPRLIILSTLSGDDPIVAGFELGADDYIVKPFSIPEVIARVRAVLRSADQHKDDSPVLHYHELNLWVNEARLRVRDTPVNLRGLEFRVLEFLMRHPGRAFSRCMLLDRVWGEDRRAQERAVDVVIQRLRKALTEHGCDGYLQTVRSVGYSLQLSDKQALEDVDSGLSPAAAVGAAPSRLPDPN